MKERFWKEDAGKIVYRFWWDTGKILDRCWKGI